MKTTINIMMGFLMSTSVFADETITPGEVATLLSSPKVAPCLAELYELAKPNVKVNARSDITVSKDDDSQEITTRISYMVFTIGSDLISHKAELSVVEKLNQIRHTTYRIVEGCKFEKFELY